MYCSFLNGECYYQQCLSCCHYLDSCSAILYPQQFNYECPDCHGKFTTPVSEETGETELMDIKEIGTPNVIVYQKIVPVLRYVCPFCGRLMKGLK